MSSSCWLVLPTIAALLFSLPSFGDSLVPPGSLWRWRPGTNEASTPIPAWRGLEFADAQFTPAPAPFWYGDVLPDGTQIAGMQNTYSCLFLRIPFDVTNLADVSGLQMSALVDDGFVAWINGTEVLRVGMPGDPGSPVTIATLANNAPEPVSFSTFVLPSPASYLRTGTNLLAVQVFQSNIASSDLGFECALDSIVLVDRTPPAVAGLSPGGGATVRALSTLTVRFSEPVSGVDATDLLVNGAPASGLTPTTAIEYVFTFPEPAVGIVELAWDAGHGIHDQATNPNPFAGGTWTYRLDPNAPEQPPYISEFMASNTRTWTDETGEYPDWIEIFNPSGTALDLDGWSLSDSPGNLTKWRFPSTNVPSGGFLVVFASGNNRRVTGAPLHTSFQLAADGEYLALVRPDGVTVVSEFTPVFPRQLPDVSHGVIQVVNGGLLERGPSGAYFTQPTPGAANDGGATVPGPILADVRHLPNLPLDHEDLTVTANVRETFQPVANVSLRYRILFGAEVTTPMLDDGAHGDGSPGDGIFGARIPANLSTNGQMIRYFVSATDTGGNPSRWPLFTQPRSTPEYLGTIVNPTNLATKLPVFHLFVAPAQTAAVDSESGGRLSFFYDGEFYDNVYMELRGNTSAGLSKKSHRLEFNRGHELRHAASSVRTRRSSLLAEYLDPTYLRQHLCFWLLGNIGVPAPYNYPVRVHMNGQFYQLAFHSDVIGREQVERMGYDPRGALYKAVGNLTPNFSSTGVFQKLEPEGDPSRTDYIQLANGINESSPITVRRNTVFDLLDVPQVINHLAGTRWCAENDDVWANMSLYRDTFGDGLWRNIPFDMNASWGQLYGGSSPLEATVDSSKSHPLYGGSSTEGNFNRLYDVIVRLPETREMLLRRQRSILDQWVQPPETPAAARILENYVRQMTNLISPEATLDRAKWGFSPWAPGKTFNAGVGDLINQFIVPRRRHWYVTHSITNTGRPIGITSASNAGIPLAQPLDASLSIVGVDFNPSSGIQAQEYVALSNSQPYAVDISGWKLEGGVTFTFQPGTVVPSNRVLHVSPDVRQFRARTSGPRGGQGLFVVGPYSGQLSARGETLTLNNHLGQTVAIHPFAGDPSLAQQFLRVTEIMYHPRPMPAESTDADEFEFIEFRNISETTALDLTGVRIVNGVDFTFTGNAITNIAPGARLLVVGNATAFAHRFGDNLPVVGVFNGRLDNGGERLRVLDASNEEILDFTFDDDWYPATDGSGFSLVTVDDKAEPDAWNNRSQWRTGNVLDGTPGSYAVDSDGDGLPDSWEMETFGTLDVDPSADPDGDGFSNRQEFIAGTHPNDASSVFRIETVSPPPEIMLRFQAISNRTYSVQFIDSLGVLPWQKLEDVAAAATNRTVAVHDPYQGSHRYYRITTPRQP